jgi:hypothetical protein
LQRWQPRVVPAGPIPFVHVMERVVRDSVGVEPSKGSLPRTGGAARHETHSMPDPSPTLARAMKLSS